MTWSSRRQLLYISIVLVVFLFLVAIILVRQFSVEPTCFDGKQNGNETGIDVGGDCVRVDPVEARMLVPIWSRPFRVTDSVYSALAYLENQNPNAGAREIRFEFKLYDEENILVAEPVRRTAFVGPSERTAIFVGGIPTSQNRTPRYAFFRLLDTPDWVRVSTPFSVSDLVTRHEPLRDLDTQPKLRGSIANTGPLPIHDIEVVAIIYDTDDNAVAVSQTIVDMVQPNETQNIFFSWPEAFDREVVRVELIPRVNIFSPRNQ